MTLTIREVCTPRDLKAFVKLPHQILHAYPQWVPSLLRDEFITFNPARNPFHENAETRLFLAFRDRRPVGRIAAILSHAANRKYGTQNMRFGWFDTLEDYDAAEGLFNAVSNWARSMGMKSLTGPHGFSNLDPQGMLIEGFEHLGTIHAPYNPPYYAEYAERYGFAKEIDYVEMRSRPPKSGLDSRYLKIRQRLENSTRVRLLRLESREQTRRLSKGIFSLLGQTYESIYGVVPLSDSQVEYVTRKFLSIIDLKLVNVAVDREDRVIGVLITMPSLSRAFQKSGGRLFPWGWVHIMRGMKTSPVLDFLLIGVKDSYQKSGLPILLLIDLAERALALGYQSSESAPMLENNLMVQSLHKYFDTEIHKRRRVFRLDPL
jgi:hypothetical protein